MATPERHIARRPKLSGRRWGLLSGSALYLALAATAAADPPDNAAQPGRSVDDRTSGIAAGHARSETETVIVTAQRRAQNLQDVPISVQTLSGETLKRLNIENFDDLLKELPNVTATGFGPGQDNIHIRGLAIGGDEGGQGGGGVGSFPNVAVYLDDQSAQVPGRNLDIYPADLARVEVLEGPQGTLFGSGAQGGVVRYITNKPDLTRFSGTVDAGFAGTEHGDFSKNVDITLNMPIVPDKLAFRLTAYDDQRGGYIDNVPGTFVRNSSDKGIGYANYIKTPMGVSILPPPTAINSTNNFGIAGNNINPLNYAGGRAELLAKFDDDWNALLSQSVQTLDADGVFYEEPQTSGNRPVKLPDLSVQLFNPTYDHDFFENSALTINGRIGFLKLVYDGAYLIRNTSQVQDYTNYARGIYADQYQCIPTAVPSSKPQCYSPSATWQDFEHDTHLSQEVRVSTPDSWRLRAVGGFYYEDFEVENRTNFNYLTAPGFTQIAPAIGSTAVDPNIRSPNTGFFDDITRGYTQYAIFGSADFDIIPKVLTATFGTRWFDVHNFEKGSVVSAFGCTTKPPYSYFGPSPCLVGATNLDSKNLESPEYGFRNRANLTWKITPDILVYYTYSEGYRPGGFNRRAPQTKIIVNGVKQVFVGPIAYQSDGLTNNEIGYKTQFFDHRLTINGSFYQEDWNNVQDRLFDPGAFGNLAFTVNGPNYHVRGTEIQVTAIPVLGLTLNTNVALNDSKQLNSPPITSPNGETLPGSAGVFGNVGDTLAQSPAFKGAFRARYEFDVGDYLAYCQIGVQHSSHQHSAVASFHNFTEKPITTADAAVGIAKDDWRLQAYVENFTNERGQEFISAAQFVTSIIVTRPLTAGLKLSYSFR